MMEPVDEQNGDTGRLGRRSTEQLEIEIHQEKVRVLVDGVGEFLSDERKLALLMSVVEKILDSYFKARAKSALAGFGLTALGAIVLSGLAYLGWKGWAGPGGGR